MAGFISATIPAATGKILAAQKHHPGPGQTAGAGKGHAAANVGMEWHSSGPAKSRRATKQRAHRPVVRRNPRQFSPRATGIVARAGPCSDADVDSAARRLRARQHPGHEHFSEQLGVGEEIKIDGINYTVVGVLEARAARSAATRTISPSSPSPPALNRYGRWCAA
jgi:hypothetical protein